MTRSHPLSLSALLACWPFAVATAQSNAVPGRDLVLIDTSHIQQFQRAGTFPDGVSALGVFSTVCNAGSSPIPFISAMDPNHAFIHYAICRESDDRLLQISSRGYVKHTTGSGNQPSPCGNCAGPGNLNQVEVGCLDTYANFQAVDHYDLGPPEEIDPWLGTWVPQCSHFDRGEPEVAAKELCDSHRSLSHEQANLLNQTVNHQMSVPDAELAAPGTFWFMTGYLCPGEPEANRDNNLGSRGFTPTWNGSSWSITDGPDFANGTVLQRWSGATVTSAANGADDGRFYVAVKVTGPNGGLYHYEYAVHNRDNARGLGAFRVPICPAASVQDFGFHGLDPTGASNWSASRGGDSIVWQTGTNPLRWNMIFNFWFDSNAGPATERALALDEFDPGAGAPQLDVVLASPTALSSLQLGPGCGLPDVPTLYTLGTPPFATLGNSTFALGSDRNPPGAQCGFLLVLTPGIAVGNGCTLYAPNTSAMCGPYFAIADGSGTALMPVPVPNQPAFEGVVVDYQEFNIGSTGALFDAINLSPGIRVRVGSHLSGCP